LVHISIRNGEDGERRSRREEVLEEEVEEEGGREVIEAWNKV